MMIEVAVAYSVNGKSEGARGNSSVSFAEVHTCDVPILDDGDAPIIATWREDTPDHIVRSGYREQVVRPPYHGDETIRRHNGHFWRPLRMYEFAEGSDDDLSEVDLAAFSRVLSRSQAKAISTWQNGKTRKNRVPEDHFVTIERTNRDIARREVDNYLSRFAIINGTVYIKCGLPTATFDRVGYAAFVRLITTDRDLILNTRGYILPVQAYGEALKKVNRLNAQAFDKKADILAYNESRAPTFLHENLARTMAEDECALSLHRFISIVEHKPELLPPGDHRRLKLFCDLTTALGMLPEDEGFELLEAAGREYLDRYSYYEQYLHHEQRALERALEIAESREVTIDVGMSSLTYG